MSRPITDPTAEIEVLQEQIELVKQEAGRLNEAEWTLLMMLEHAAAIIEFLNEHRLAHEGRHERGGLA